MGKHSETYFVGNPGDSTARVMTADDMFGRWIRAARVYDTRASRRFMPARYAEATPVSSSSETLYMIIGIRHIMAQYEDGGHETVILAGSGPRTRPVLIRLGDVVEWVESEAGR